MPQGHVVHFLSSLPTLLPSSLPPSLFLTLSLSFFFLSLPPSLSLLSFFLCKPYSFLQEYSLVLFFVLFFLVMGMVYRDHILSIASDHCYWNFQW